MRILQVKNGQLWLLPRYIDQDEDHETAEKLKDLELDIEDAVEKTVRTVEKIASLSRTISNIR